MTLRADLSSNDVLYLYTDWRGQVTAGTWPGGWIDGYGPNWLVDWQSKRLSTWADQLSQFEEYSPNETWMGSFLSNQRNGTRDLYKRNRYYDPTSGRFTQEDPIGLAGGLNLYGFAGGDPVNFSDPFGLCPPCGGLDFGLGHVIRLTLRANHQWSPAPGESPSPFLNALVQQLKDPQFTADGYFFSITGLGFASSFSMVGMNALAGSAGGVGPLAGTRYTSKVIDDIARGDRHAFPLEVDNFAGDATVTSLRGGDGVLRQKVVLPGYWRGEQGTFQWIIEPGKAVNHRLWVPDK